MSRQWQVVRHGEETNREKGRADRVGPHGSEKDEHSDLSERPREHVRTVRMAMQQRGLERTETKQAKREI